MEPDLNSDRQQGAPKNRIAAGQNHVIGMYGARSPATQANHLIIQEHVDVELYAEQR